MISDKDLRDAARACEKAILESLPRPEDCPAEFSPAFERRMKKLIFRVDHPVLYWLRRVLPVLLLAGLAAAAMLLLGARTAHGKLPHPRATPAPAESEQPPEALVYRPTWLPEGCELVREALYGDEGMIFYTAADGTQAVFMYAAGSQPWTEDDLQNGIAVPVGDCSGVLCLGQSKGTLNDLFWSDEEAGASFWISAPFPEAEMVRMAESVEAQSE